MQSVQQIANEIIAREGGFVDDPDDPGGATKYGVTIHTMRRLGLDLTRDGTVDRRAQTEMRAALHGFGGCPAIPARLARPRRGGRVGGDVGRRQPERRLPGVASWSSEPAEPSQPAQ